MTEPLGLNRFIHAIGLHRILVAGLLLIYVLLATSLDVTKAPICDEGWYGNPAINLIQNGNMGSPVIEGTGGFLKDIDRYTYWIMPGYILAQAGLYKIFDPSLFVMRGLSTFAGLIVLMCWYAIVRLIGGGRGLALLVLLFAGIDTTFLALSATGRSDMLSLAFGTAAQASYLLWRERNLQLSLLVSHSFVVASGLTHPIGGLVSLGAVLFLYLYLDRGRWHLSDLMFIGTPYLFGSIFWAAYIIKQPDAFWSQFSGNAGERLRQLEAPAQAIQGEFTKRWIDGYRIGSSSWTPLANLHLLVLVAYVSGLTFVALRPAVRRSRIGTIVLVEAALALFVLTFFEGSKQPWYLIHLVWPLTAALALTVQRVWQRRAQYRSILTVSIAALLCIEAGYPVLLTVKDRYRNSYLASVKAIQGSGAVRPGSVMGSAELGFALGFDKVIDDHYLGYYTHKEPEFVVVDSNYLGFLRDFQQTRRPIYRYFQSLLAHRYKLRYADEHYRVYTHIDRPRPVPTS